MGRVHLRKVFNRKLQIFGQACARGCSHGRQGLHGGREGGHETGQLVIPAFTKGKSQLDPVDVEKNGGTANVRIHVERVIGLLRRKYTIPREDIGDREGIPHMHPIP